MLGFIKRICNNNSEENAGVFLCTVSVRVKLPALSGVYRKLITLQKLLTIPL